MNPLAVKVQIPFPEHAKYCSILEELEMPGYVEAFLNAGDVGIGVACAKLVAFKSLITKHGGTFTDKKWERIKLSFFKRQFTMTLMISFSSQSVLDEFNVDLQELLSKLSSEEVANLITSK